MLFPYKAPFSHFVLTDWLVKNNPAEVGMNDNQYFWYTDMIARSCKKDVNGIPITFLDAQKV